MHTKKEKKVTGNLRTFYGKQCLEKKCVQPYVVTLQTLCPNTKKVKLSACPKQISVNTWQWLKDNIHVYVYLQTLLGHQCKIVSTCTCAKHNCIRFCDILNSTFPTHTVDRYQRGNSESWVSAMSGLWHYKTNSPLPALPPGEWSLVHHSEGWPACKLQTDHLQTNL